MGKSRNAHADTLHGGSRDGETGDHFQLKKILLQVQLTGPGRRAPPSIARYPWLLERGPGASWPSDPAELASHACALSAFQTEGRGN
jgi:hypothetical protein